MLTAKPAAGAIARGTNVGKLLLARFLDPNNTQLTASTIPNIDPAAGTARRLADQEHQPDADRGRHRRAVPRQAWHRRLKRDWYLQPQRPHCSRDAT